MDERCRRFERMVDGFAGDVYRYAFALCRNETTAEDLVQETFARAWRFLDSQREPGKARAPPRQSDRAAPAAFRGRDETKPRNRIRRAARATARRPRVRSARNAGSRRGQNESRAGREQRHANRLADSNDPYLLLHAHNPVARAPGG